MREQGSSSGWARRAGLRWGLPTMPALTVASGWLCGPGSGAGGGVSLGAGRGGGRC